MKTKNGGGLLVIFCLFFNPSVLGQELNFNPEEVLTVLSKDAIKSIDQPKFLTPSEADVLQMYEKEPVIGVEMGGEAKAYPIYVLSAHEIVNDSIAGRPIAITW